VYHNAEPIFQQFGPFESQEDDLIKNHVWGEYLNALSGQSGKSVNGTYARSWGPSEPIPADYY